MGTVYAPPNGFKAPDITSCDIDEYTKLCMAYEKEIVRWARTYAVNCPEAGEIISFPVCDGAARYVVASLKPVKLIHIDTGDAYSFRYANRLSAKDIRDEIKRAKALKAPFSKKKTL
jgi:hypothetical protein